MNSFGILLILLTNLALTSASGCSSQSLSPRLLQGDDVEKGDFNFVASIFRNEEFICAGVLVSPLYVLTAAHCFLNLTTGEFMKSDVKVRIGSKSSLYESGESGVVERDATYVITHQNFTSKGYNMRRRNDIALLRFSVWVTAFSPVSLPSETTPLPTSGKMFGWGATVVNGSISESLREVDLDVRPDSDCLSPFPYLQSSHFCAGDLGRAACPGDDGGPFLAQVNGKWTLFGVVSDATGCGQKETFTLFTNILKHGIFLYGRETAFSQGKLYGGFLCSSGTSLSISSLFFLPLFLLLLLFF